MGRAFTARDLAVRTLCAWVAYSLRPEPRELSPTDPHVMCRWCWTPKPLSQFSRNPARVGGYNTICKTCHAAKYNPIARAKRLACGPLPEPTAHCMKCNEHKPASQFGQSASGNRRRYCDACTAEVLTERERRFSRILTEPKSHRRRKGLVAILSDGTLTDEVREAMFRAAKECPYCGVRMTAAAKTLDHMVPISKGGPNSKMNALVCCRSCNSRKHDLNFDVWLERLAGEHRTRMENLYRKRFKATPGQAVIPLIFKPERLTA